MKLTLVKKQEEAKGTKSFFWQTEKPITWLPGQYYYYTLPQMKYPDPKGNTRHFSIAGSPTEGPTLRVTTRIRQESGFKKTLDELVLGAVIEGEGPSGSFILDSPKDNLQVLLAGGIGITALRPMIKYAIDKNLKTPITLIYSNSIPKEIAFREEFENWARTNPNFKLFLTVSKPEQSAEKWTGLTGRIDEALIRKLVSDVGNSTFWVCGPPAMVDAMESLLTQMGLSSDQVKSEKFTGY